MKTKFLTSHRVCAWVVFRKLNGANMKVSLNRLNAQSVLLVITKCENFLTRN